MTKEELIEFEKEISDRYCEGKIRAPVHLSDGNEDQLIEIFKQIKQTDWVFSTWRSHYHALLHGVPKEKVREKIMAGESITLMFPEHKFLSSAIVGGIVPIAMGAALGVKRQGGKEHVWCFVGDMSAETGIFHECVKYSENFDLPITMVIECNKQSVGTPTYEVWGYGNREYKNTLPVQISEKVWKYEYVKQFPHVGSGRWIVFAVMPLVIEIIKNLGV